MNELSDERQHNSRRAARPQGELVLITELWERVSSKGTRHLSGYLGKARLVGFQGKPRDDGTPTWKLFVQSNERDGQ